MSLQFISKENQPVLNRNSRKNKHRQFYTWQLERLVKVKMEVGFSMDCFPSSSEMRGIQLVKEAIVVAMNSGNLFDFEYAPMERDYLTIRNDKDRGVYLTLIFLNGNWEEEQYLGSFRDPNTDVYETIKTGLLELE